MRLVKFLTATIGLVFLAGCGDQGLGPEPSAPALAVAGDSGCYAVHFTVTIIPVGGNASTGAISGELEGTADITLIDVEWPPTGATNTSTFAYRWNITGGTVAPLIGRSFDTLSENRNILHFLRPPAKPFVTNIGSHRVVAGVSKANFTYVGETSIATSQTTLEHRGVICL